MSRPKTILVDLDGVICSEESFFNRPLARPLPGAAAALRKLRRAGHTVVIYTARGWGELKVTQRWLADHGIEYDGLHMGKPIADVWIDDRALQFRGWDATLRELGVAGTLRGAAHARGARRASRADGGSPAAESQTTAPRRAARPRGGAGRPPI